MAIRFIATPTSRLAHCGAVSSVQRASLPVMMALLLGMFNPLFCIVHCAVTNTTAHQRASFGSIRFVCHLSDASHSSATDQGRLPDQNPAMPRAVYDGVLILLALCSALLLLTTRLSPPGRRRWQGESLAPPFPPPKSWRLLSTWA